MVLIVFALTGAYAEKADFRVGPAYSDQEKTLDVVVELPVAYIPAASQFLLMVGDKQVGFAGDIKPFKQSGRSLAIVLCVDVSGSIGKPALIEIQKALNYFIVRSRPEDLIALVSFADEPRIESGFQQSRDHLKAGIRNLKIRGRLSRIYETLNQTLKLFNAPNLPLRRRVIILSDGKDEESRDDRDATVISYTKKGIAIDAVARGKIAQIGDVLRLLVNGTGGQFEHALPANLSVKDALTKIYAFLLQERSMVVSFEYEREPSGLTTEDAHIELVRSGEGSSRLSIPTPIPRPRIRADNRFKTIVVVLVGLAAIGFVAGLIIKHIKSKGGTEVPGGPTEPTGKAPPLPVNSAGSAQPAYDATRIGGYSLPAPAKGRPAAILTGVSGSLETRRFPIDKELFHIGASGGNDLCITDDEYVSGEHAYLKYQQGRLFVYDCNSLNGTTVNQVPVTDTGLILEIGDRIRVGDSAFVVEQVSDAGN